MTREQMEARRLRAAELLAGGMSQADVARVCGVSRTCTSRWGRQMREGVDMRMSKATGRPPKLTAEQKEELKTLWSCRRKWTCLEFAAVIEAYFAVKYDPDHVSRLVRELGLRGKRGYIKKDEMAEIGVAPV
jgi:transposase